MSRDDRDFVFDPAVGEDDSPVADVIELTSRKWTRTIVEHLLAHDSLRYNELKREVDGISDKVLSESLDEMERLQLVSRDVIDEKPVRVEYSLTEAGAALETVIDAVGEWTETYLDAIDESDLDG